MSIVKRAEEYTISVADGALDPSVSLLNDPSQPRNENPNIIYDYYYSVAKDKTSNMTDPEKELASFILNGGTKPELDERTVRSILPRLAGSEDLERVDVQERFIELNIFLSNLVAPGAITGLDDYRHPTSAKATDNLRRLLNKGAFRSPLAACIDEDPEIFFSDDIKLAQRFCASCPVQKECLDFALKHNEDHGIWGGKSERARKRIKKQRRLEQASGL